MMNKEISSLLNEQINKELYSAYLYIDIANYFAEESLHGFENWFFVQAQEERDHALLFRSYLLNNDQKIVLDTVAAPEKQYGNYKSPLLITLEHEQLVTASINTIYAAAYREKDFRTMQFLDWFVKEQGEEEKNATDLIKKFDLFGNDAKSLYMLDQELAARVYVPPTLIL